MRVSQTLPAQNSKKEGHRVTIIYTVVENWRRYDVPVETYLREILTHLPALTDPEAIAKPNPSKDRDPPQQEIRCRPDTVE